MMFGKTLDNDHFKKMAYDPSAIALLKYYAQIHEETIERLAQLYAMRRGDTLVHSWDVNRALIAINNQETT
jgi:hypothetical protein